MEKQSFDIANHGLKDQSSQPFGEVDFGKILKVLKSSVPWIVIIMLFSNLGAYLFNRYTKPLYESSTDIKLEFKSEANSLLGYGGLLDDNYNNLSGEIELIRSRLLFSRVVESMDLDITYQTAYGSILNEERYGNSPFTVDYEIKNSAYYDKPFSITLLNENTYQLTYSIGAKSYSNIYRFGEAVETNGFLFVIRLSNHFKGVNPDENKFIFTINSERALINYLKKNTAVQPLNLKANTIRITFRDYNKYKAQDIVNHIAEHYLEYTLEDKKKSTRNKIEFLNEQLEQTSKKLETTEEYFEDFIIDNRTTNLQSNLSGIIQQLNALDSQRIQVNYRLDLLQEIEENVRKDSIQAERLLLYNELNPMITNNLQQFSNLLTEQKMLLTSYKENTFAYQRKQKTLHLLKEKLLTYLESSQQQSREALKSLKKRNKQLENVFLQLPSKKTEYGKVERQHELYLGFYLTLMQSKAQFEVAQAGTTTNFVILSQGSLPSDPISPNKLLIHGLGGAIGVFLSLFFIAVRYLLHNKISSPAELERLLSTPLLGMVPRYKSSSAYSELVIHQQPKSLLSESLRSIRTNLEFMQSHKPQRIISITSTVSGEGKTFLATNLGGTLALSNQRVVILDLDLRKPKIHRAFGDEESVSGISTLLIRRDHPDDCIRRTPIDNLDYIPAGTVPPNPAELLMHKNFDRLLRKLQDRYDVIIMDTPPVGLVTDAMLVMQKADIPIYVVRSEFSKKSYLKTLERLVQINGFDNISVVLNAARLGSTYGGYSLSYYAESGYFDEHDQKLSRRLLKKFKLR